MTYPIPAQRNEVRLEIKKSKFFASAGFADTREAAMAMLDDLQHQYPDARHHCWAYILGNPESPASAAMSDDGEPSGTAGKPILNVLQHKNIGDIMLVVTRYFGGIKLGAGGLVRAYSAAAQQAIELLPVQQQIAMRSVTLCTDFRHEQYLRHWVELQQGKIKDCIYREQVVMTLALPAPAFEALPDLTGSLGCTILSGKHIA
ncbi:YigZ family protein [Alteromonas pelagimontana]|uniref:YigZ family protein n=1 Tax=Alteromonas pelagimontana TaxID=1858656 RepID=A0A6M4MI23_9ALTE|nr:YigZ family protein [Alteromonas pelagimontana]QJR82743.1 YigZ family protein [Alteromonas pelagimontana]